MSRHRLVAWVRVGGLVCLCAAIAAPGAGSGQSPGIPRPQEGRQAHSDRLAAMPEVPKGEQPLPPGTSQGWWSKVQQDIRQQEYSVTWSDQTPLADLKGAWQAPNRAQGFRTYFTEKGIRLVPRTEESPSWEWGLELARWGREGAWQEAASAEPRAEANRVTLDRPGIQEWYVNDERGLEQGFTIPSPPAAADALSPHSSLLAPHHLSIDLALSGTLRPVISEDGQAVDFYGDGNFNVLRYAQLEVTDASGRALPARFEGTVILLTPHSSLLTSPGLRIVVDDSTAIYPITVDPLATSPAWTATGDGTSNYFGFLVATAGDVNGDGYSDVIVGAYGYSANAGKAYLYLGGPAGLASANAWTAVGGTADDYFGYSAATAGDVNGDGYSDVIVGARGINTNTGKAYLYLGGPSGLSVSPAWTALGEAANTNFGYSVATAGDVNGDDYSDVIIGAATSVSGSGKAYVYLGGPDGLAGSPAWTATGESSSQFGCSVDTAGDVNGDGYSDVIVGAQHKSSYTGKAYVYLGGPYGLSVSAAWTADGQAANDYFGHSVATAGDVNGDGYSDVIVGAYGNSGYDGKAYVYHGSPAGLAVSTAWTAIGVSGMASQFGCSVTTAGDVNGDGYSDVIVGAGSYYLNHGEAYVYHGGPSGLYPSAAWTVMGEDTDNYFGVPVAAAGDVNGDGYSDVIVGGCGYTGYTGKAYLYLGGPSALASANAWTATGESGSSTYPYFSISLASAGDVNGDGYSDVVVGSHGYDSDRGKAYLYLGGPAGLSATASWTALGESTSSYFGVCVCGAGDVNGDGYADVAVSAYGYDSDRGKVYLYMGGPSGLGATSYWTAQGEALHDWFGTSVAGAGDVNGDGYCDVVVGAYGPDASRGKAYLYLGGPSGLAAASSWSPAGEDYGNLFGWSVAAAGDVNGDGYSDVVVGASGYDMDRGKGYLYLGGPSGLSSTYSWSAQGEATSALYGACVATAGDVNGDGYSDVLVGSAGFPSEDMNGKAYLYLGGPGGLSASAAWTKVGEALNDFFGYSVATAGDVNGDGYSDVVVGAYANDSQKGKVYQFLGSAAGLSTASSWSATGENYGDQFGRSVAGAGDVNGDGYSDVVAGAYMYSLGKGRTYLRLGNGRLGAPARLRQLRSDLAAPVAPLGLAREQSFRLGLTTRSPVGRTTARIQYQLAPLGGTFHLLLNPVQTHTTWWASTGQGSARTIPISLPDEPVAYLWRARLKYNPITSPFLPYSPWFTPCANGLRETDLRSSSAALPPSCVVPDEPCWLYSVTKSGTNYTLNWQDPNQPDQRTGWNIRRSNDASLLPKTAWPLVGSNVADMDAGASNYQWTDHSGDDPTPSLLWFYEVTTYNLNCPAEGPF